MAAEDSASTQEETQAAAGSQDKTFTQEQVNKIVADRLARAKAAVPDDYEDLKAKAAEYDKAQEAAKSDLQKALERAEKAEGALNERNEADKRKAAVDEAAKAAKLPAELTGILHLMQGDPAENAKALTEAIESTGKTRYRQTRDRGEAAQQGADSMHEVARMLFGSNR